MSRSHHHSRATPPRSCVGDLFPRLFQSGEAASRDWPTNPRCRGDQEVHCGYDNQVSSSPRRASSRLPSGSVVARTHLVANTTIGRRIDPVHDGVVGWRLRSPYGAARCSCDEATKNLCPIRPYYRSGLVDYRQCYAFALGFARARIRLDDFASSRRGTHASH